MVSSNCIQVLIKMETHSSTLHIYNVKITEFKFLGAPCKWWNLQNSISNNLFYFFEVSSFIGKVLSIPYCAGHALINPGSLKVKNRHSSGNSREAHLVVSWRKIKNIVFDDKKKYKIIKRVLVLQ